MKSNSDPLIIEEISPYEATYDWGKGYINISFNPDLMARCIKRYNIFYQMSLDRIKKQIDDCFRKAANLRDNRQSISEPLKEGD